MTRRFQYQALADARLPPVAAAGIGTPVQLGQANGVSSGVSFSTSADSPAGNCIVVLCVARVAAATVSGVTDSAGNTYSQAVQASGAGVAGAAIFYAANAAHLANGGTITVTTSSGVYDAQAISIPNVRASSPVDKTNSQIETVATNAPPALASGTLSFTDEIVLAVTSIGGGSTGYASNSPFTGNTGTGGNFSGSGYDIVSVTSSVSYAPTWTTARAASQALATFMGIAPTPAGLAWLMPLDEPSSRRRKPLPEYPFEFRGFVPPSYTAPNFAWHAALSEPNRPRRPTPENPELSVGLQPPPYVAPAIGWLEALDEPNRPRKPLPQYPFEALGLAAPAYVSPSTAWHQPLSEPNRPRKPIPEQPQPVVALVPGAYAAPSFAWHVSFSEPNRPRKPLPEYPFHFAGLSPSAYTAPSFSWHLALSEPVRTRKLPLVDIDGSIFFIPAGGAAGFFNLGWLQALSEPVPPPRKLWPHYTQPETAWLPGSYAAPSAAWLQAWSEPARAKRLLGDAYGDVLFVPLSALSFGWFQAFSEPWRPRKPVPDPASADVLFARPYSAPSIAWLQALSEPNRPRRPLAEQPFHFAGLTPPPYIAPSIAWLSALSEPNRVRKLVIDLDGNVFFIPAAGASGFFNLGWLQAFSEPVKLRRPPPDYPQPVVGLVPTPFVVPPVGWIQALSEPSRARRMILDAAAGDVFFRAPTLLSFGWHQGLSEPTRLRRWLDYPQPGLVSLPPPYAVPPVAWLQAWSEPRRVKRLLTDLGGDVFFIPPAVLAALSFGWFQPFSEPSRLKQQLWKWDQSGLVIVPVAGAPDIIAKPLMKASEFIISLQASRADATLKASEGNATLIGEVDN